MHFFPHKIKKNRTVSGFRHIECRNKRNKTATESSAAVLFVLADLPDYSILLSSLSASIASDFASRMFFTLYIRITSRIPFRIYPIPT